MLTVGTFDKRSYLYTVKVILFTVENASVCGCRTLPNDWRGPVYVYTAILYSQGDPPMCNITEQDATQAPGLFSAF